jgi:hypothetical protein
MGWKETDKIGRKERVYFQIREPGEGGSGNLPEVWNKYQDRLQGSFTVYGTRVAGLAELSRASKNNANKVAEAVKKGLLKLKEKHTYRGAVPPGNHGNLLRKLPKELYINNLDK